MTPAVRGWSDVDTRQTIDLIGLSAPEGRPLAIWPVPGAYSADGDLTERGPSTLVRGLRVAWSSSAWSLTVGEVSRRANSYGTSHWTLSVE